MRPTPIGALETHFSFYSTEQRASARKQRTSFVSSKDKLSTANAGSDEASIGLDGMLHLRFTVV